MSGFATVAGDIATIMTKAGYELLTIIPINTPPDADLDKRYTYINNVIGKMGDVNSTFKKKDISNYNLILYTKYAGNAETIYRTLQTTCETIVKACETMASWTAGTTLKIEHLRTTHSFDTQKKFIKTEMEFEIIYEI
jgi:hypothetical protein